MTEPQRKPGVRALGAILFDLDGTLADTAPDLSAALNRVRRDRGLEPLPLAQLRPYASHGARGLLGAGMSVAPGEPFYEELRDAFLSHYEAALCVDSALFATSNPARRARCARAAVGYRHQQGDTLYDAAARLAPSRRRARRPSSAATRLLLRNRIPRRYEAASRLGVAPEHCVYVGDARRDIEAGKAAGMRTLVARWGYIEPDDTPEAGPPTAFWTSRSRCSVGCMRRARR